MRIIKCYFPGAEWNKKCFSHIQLELGNRSCYLWQAACFFASAITDLFSHSPTHRFQVFFWLLSDSLYVQVFFVEFAVKVRLWRLVWHGCQWCVRSCIAVYILLLLSALWIGSHVLENSYEYIFLSIKVL